MAVQSPPLEVQIWPIDRLILYARNPRKNDAVVDRMCSSIREFGFKIPVLARSDGEVVDGHLRIKAARKLRMTKVPVILCDEWSPAQVKAFRLMVNRSVSWASWDDELLALELQELSEADFELSLTGFDPGEIDALLVSPEHDELANAAPPLPEVPVSRPGDLWLCGPHRVSRHRVKVGQRPDGRDEYEERPGEQPPNHVEDQDPNVMRLYLVRAQETRSEVENGASAD
jgi:hypothetical protein